eukprot:TRINITY_DN31595_c0_g1_i1.p1 TRINITY_DN31595_c0_g1~~TRINITY_DN31595_c0_g1_i1.p1  ORF type:complete len:434 (-),score=38.18 TRINITY_DN31595_c0_g1_i1:356-1657(-)
MHRAGRSRGSGTSVTLNYHGYQKRTVHTPKDRSGSKASSTADSSPKSLAFALFDATVDSLKARLEQAEASRRRPASAPSYRASSCAVRRNRSKSLSEAAASPTDASPKLFQARSSPSSVSDRGGLSMRIAGENWTSRDTSAPGSPSKRQSLIRPQSAVAQSKSHLTLPIASRSASKTKTALRPQSAALGTSCGRSHSATPLSCEGFQQACQGKRFDVGSESASRTPSKHELPSEKKAVARPQSAAGGGSRAQSYSSMASFAPAKMLTASGHRKSSIDSTTTQSPASSPARSKRSMDRSPTISPAVASSEQSSALPRASATGATNRWRVGVKKVLGVTQADESSVPSDVAVFQQEFVDELKSRREQFVARASALTHDDIETEESPPDSADAASCSSPSLAMASNDLVGGVPRLLLATIVSCGTRAGLHHVPAVA